MWLNTQSFDGWWRSANPPVEKGFRGAWPTYGRAMELWTERRATRHLAVPGVGRDAARSALKAGVAGRPTAVSRSLLYDADAVRAALGRMDPPCEIAIRTSRPIFVARVCPRVPDPDSGWRGWRGADVLAPRQEQLDAVRGWWHIGTGTEILTDALGRHRGMPFVATCGGIIVLGAEITAIDEDLSAEGSAMSEERRSASRQGAGYTRHARAFVLGDPGPWFEGQLGRRFTLGAGGPFRLVFGRSGVLGT